MCDKPVGTKDRETLRDNHQKKYVKNVGYLIQFPGWVPVCRAFNVSTLSLGPETLKFRVSAGRRGLLFGV